MHFAIADIAGTADGGWHLQLFLSLLLVVCLVSIVVKMVRLPYSIALVIAGLIVGIGRLLPPVEMTPELVLVIMLPTLLFEASWNLDVRQLAKSWRPITVLVTVGVLISMAVVALMMCVFTGLGLMPALVFGALIAATDPISVLAMFRKLGVDSRLTIILEGESLFNDGTAFVLFKFVLALALAGAAVSVTSAAIGFMVIVAGAILLGVLLGVVAGWIASRFSDHLMEATLTVLVAYGSYLLAEALQLSPVIATICAGLAMGNCCRKSGTVAATTQAVALFWEIAAFVANSILFLLIGLQMKLPLLLSYWQYIAWGIAGILVGRALLVYLLCPFMAGKHNPLPVAWRHVLAWGGLRGSLCMALALSLPENFPQREAVLVTTFGVVLFTLLVQGLTIEPLVKLLKLKSKSSEDQGG